MIPAQEILKIMYASTENGTDNGYAALTYRVSIKNIQNQRFMKGNEKMINAEYSKLEFELWTQAIINIAEE